MARMTATQFRSHITFWRYSAATLKFSVLFALLLWLTGCAVTSTTTTKETQNRPTQIDNLLQAAQQAYKEDKLTTPEGDNAFEYYNQALKLDPTNQMAQAGISSIVDQYLAWALDHIDQGNFDRASRYIKRAERVDENHPSIAVVKNRISEGQQQSVQVFYLNQSAVRTRNRGRLPLDTIVDEIVKLKPFVTIRAPDDPTGRWLYQLLNDQVSFRIEAEFEINREPSITLTR